MRKAYILDTERGRLQITEFGGTVGLSIKYGGDELSVSLDSDQWQDLCELRYRVQFKTPDDVSADDLMEER